MEKSEKITVETRVNAPVEKAWQCWTDATHITHWNFASEDWWCPRADIDLRVGGKLTSRMEARDGSMGFDFTGEYTRIEPFRLIEFRIEDGRQVSVQFTSEEGTTLVTETFEAENINPVEMQRVGWQAILDNFKKHTESV